MLPSLSLIPLQFCLREPSRHHVASCTFVSSTKRRYYYIMSNTLIPGAPDFLSLNSGNGKKQAPGRAVCVRHWPDIHETPLNVPEEREKEREREREREREGERETGTETAGTETETDRHRQRQRQTERQRATKRHRDRDRQGYRETETDRQTDRQRGTEGASEKENIG